MTISSPGRARELASQPMQTAVQGMQEELPSIRVVGVFGTARTGLDFEMPRNQSPAASLVNAQRSRHTLTFEGKREASTAPPFSVDAELAMKAGHCRSDGA